MSQTGSLRSASLVEALLTWFDARERDVPWRSETDPFAILVAEVMAQQTRIETVRPYYRRFRERFPTATALAAAHQDEVLRLWEGLGYYARARNLHAASRVIVERHAGQVPRTAEALLRLPGVGRYTAGAVASLAFGAAEPAVDGNARRVLSRVFDLEDAGPSAMDRAARELLRAGPDRPGALNQALMDLGSAVCTARQPSCEACPISFACLARERGTVGVRPTRRPKPEKPERSAVATVIAKGAQTFVLRRPRDGLLGGLWDFPSIAVGEAVPDTGWLEREVEDGFGLEVAVGERIHEVRHTFTHFRLDLAVYEAVWRGGDPSISTDWQWAGWEALERLAFPVYQRRMIASVLEPRIGQSVPVGTS